MKRVYIVSALLLTFVLAAGCNSESVSYGTVSTGIDSYELLTTYPDLEELPDATEEGITMQVYRRSPGEDKRVEYFFLTNDRVSAVLIIFNKDTDYSLIHEELVSANGPATISTGIMGTKVSVWGEKEAAITLTKTNVDTPVNLPGGDSETLEKGETSLLLTQPVDRFGYVWYLTLTIIVLIYALNISIIKKTKKTRTQIGNTIRSRGDLTLIKDVINLSMMLAVVVIAMFTLYITGLVILVLAMGMKFPSALNHLFIFGVTTLPIGLYGKKVEKTIRTLDVEADDPEIKETYERWLKLWGKPGFKLPE